MHTISIFTTVIVMVAASTVRSTVHIRPGPSPKKNMKFGSRYSEFQCSTVYLLVRDAAWTGFPASYILPGQHDDVRSWTV